MISEDKGRISISIDKNILESLENLSKETKISKSEIIENLLKNSIVFRKKKP